MIAAADRFAGARQLFKSVLSGVPDAAWDAFVRAVSSRSIRDVSRGGGIGSFDLRPRRLGEIGVMVNLLRGDRGKWVGDLAPEYADLGRDATLQYRVFALSTKLYDADLVEGRIARPEGVSRSGALAVLHCGGKGAIDGWPRAFKTTRETFDRANDIF